MPEEFENVQGLDLGEGEGTDLQGGNNDGEGVVNDDNAGNEGNDNKDLENNKQDKGEGEGADTQKADKQQDEDNELVGTPENGFTTESIQLPEGMALNEEVLGEFDDFAKKMNMSQKAYEQSINYGVKLVEQTRDKILAAQAQLQEQRIIGYQREAFNDIEIGGDKYNEALESALVGYRYYVKNVDPDLDKYMSESGLQYNKSFIKLFKYIGGQMQDDKLKGGNNNGGNKQNKAEDMADRMFPSMNKK